MLTPPSLSIWSAIVRIRACPINVKSCTVATSASRPAYRQASGRSWSSITTSRCARSQDSCSLTRNQLRVTCLVRAEPVSKSQTRQLSSKQPVLEPTSSTRPAVAVETAPSAFASSSGPDPTTSYAANVSPPSTTSMSNQLSWNDFLALRQTRRRYNLLASVVCGGVTLTTGLNVLSTQNIDNFNLFGVDPLFVMGASTLAIGAIGWLLGPFFGGAVFNLVNRRLLPEIGKKERDLFHRIRKHRVDPSSSSAGNPVPDYYGEKIGSVVQYRTWLRDQRAYNKRRRSYV